jgi:hypothetical protein
MITYTGLPMLEDVIRYFALVCPSRIKWMKGRTYPRRSQSCYLSNCKERGGFDWTPQARRGSGLLKWDANRTFDLRQPIDGLKDCRTTWMCVPPSHPWSPGYSAWERATFPRHHRERSAQVQQPYVNCHLS